MTLEEFGMGVVLFVVFYAIGFFGGAYIFEKLGVFGR